MEAESSFGRQEHKSAMTNAQDLIAIKGIFLETDKFRAFLSNRRYRAAFSISKTEGLENLFKTLALRFSAINPMTQAEGFLFLAKDSVQ